MYAFINHLGFGLFVSCVAVVESSPCQHDDDFYHRYQRCRKKQSVLIEKKTETYALKTKCIKPISL